MSSRKFLIPAVLILLFGLSSVTLAWPEAVVSGTATNHSNSVKTDYHVRVTNAGNMSFIPAEPGKPTKGNLGIILPPPEGGVAYVGEPTVQGNGTTELIIEWKNLTVNKDDTIVWGVRIECCNNQVQIQEEWFTPRDPTIDLPIPSLGFEVKRNGEFFLTNHTEFPIVFDNLLVNIGDEPFDIETMIDTVREVVGEGSGGIGGKVDNGGEYFVKRYDELSPGMFLQATMLTSVTTADGRTNTSQRLVGHEHPGEFPTVSEWGLIVMAVLLVSAGTAVIVRRRQWIAT